MTRRARAPASVLLALLLCLPFSSCAGPDFFEFTDRNPFLFRLLFGNGFSPCPEKKEPQKIQTVKLSNPGPGTSTVTYSVGISPHPTANGLPPDPITATPADGTLLPGQTACIDLHVDGTNWSSADVVIAYHSVDSTLLHTDSFTMENQSAPAQDAHDRGHGILDIEDLFGAAKQKKSPPRDLTFHSNLTFSTVPLSFLDVILGGGSIYPLDRWTIPKPRLRKFFPPGGDALDLAPELGGLPVVGGDHYVLFMGVDGDIPQADPVGIYQYACVFDQDGNATNNYVPPAAFPGDYFRDTDRWYEVTYNPTDGWEFRVTDATNNNFMPYASAARAIVLDRGIMFAIPVTELAAQTPTYRFTAFRHEGDFGLNPPHVWSANTEPPMDQPLRPVEP